MQFPLLTPSRHTARLCLLSALAIGAGCGDDVSSTETQSSSTGSTTSVASTSTTAAATTEQGTTTTVDPDSSTSIDPDSSSTAVDPTEDTDETRGDSTTTSGEPTTTGAAESSSTGMEKMPQDCPYGDLTAPDLVSDTTLDQDSEFATSCGGGGAPDYSYLLTAPADGFYIITASSPDGVVDPIIAAFDGDCGGSELSCDRGLNGADSVIELQLTEGQVITVVADGFALAGGAVDISVTFFAGTCPDGDLGNTVPALFTGDTTMSDNTVFGSCGGDTGLDDTLTFTAPQDGVYAINTEGSAFDTLLYIRDDCDGAELACNDNVEGGVTSAAHLTMTAGQEIVVAVDAAGIESGAYNVNIDRDECPDEVIPSTVPQTISGSTVGELDASSGSCGGLGAPSYSYSFTAPEAGVYTIETTNSNFDTILYAIDACGGPDTLCNNDVGADTNSRIAVTLAADEEVLFVVDGANGESGTYDIAIDLDACPDFDLGNTAPATATGNNEADLNSSTGSCGGNGLDVAYTFTAPTTATYVFDTFGSDYDTVLYAFDGATCAADDTLACNDDAGAVGPSEISVNLMAGQEITVVVDGFGVGSTGDYTLNVGVIECGDGVIDTGEACDSDDLDGETCESQGFGGGDLACDTDFCGFDTSGCLSCGNDVIDGTDVCDGTAIGQTRCEDFGFVGGALDCDDTCGIDTAQCSDEVIVVCSAPASAINDGLPTTTDTIDIPNMGAIADVDVFLDISHSYTSDLDITLTADDLVVTNELMTDTCIGGGDMWAFLNDEGSSALGADCAEPLAIEGNLTPEAPLSAYDGMESAGAWTLSVTDTAFLDDGVLNEWCLYITLE